MTSTLTATRRTIAQRMGWASADGSTRSTRLIGIDLARGFALMGMMAAHFMLSTSPELTSPSTWGGLVNGRSSILFATLAGVSLAIISGRTTPVTGQALSQTRFKILVRAIFIFVLGSILAAMNTGISVILQTYALLFIVALAFLTMRRRWLILWAAVFSVLGPFLTYVLPLLAERAAMSPPMPELLFNSSYPALSWIPFILIGLAIGRTSLTSMRNQLSLIGIGAVLALLGYATVPVTATISSVLSGEPLVIEDDSLYEKDTASKDDSSSEDMGNKDLSSYPDPIAAANLQDGEFLLNGENATEIDLSGLECWDEVSDYGAGAQRNVNCWSQVTDDVSAEPVERSTPIDHVATLLENWATAEPHTATPHEVIGSGGFAIALIGFFLLIGSTVRYALLPVIAMGSMSLTTYTAHVVSYWFLSDMAMNADGFAWKPWLGSVAVFMFAATVWRFFFTRGPLEWLLAIIVRRTTGGGELYHVTNPQKVGSTPAPDLANSKNSGNLAGNSQIDASELTDIHGGKSA
ncbi:heparan-alpha-glucosaminide N-acetyltransferase domain-containing protein [Jonesia quinghaiensis]|uniref:heparan-alpha-glucosaminide N-acetyltransferase domain-containing protein n=1 Tax=Jonesia quinghaiensis TaxID=262806 RepID=UPI000687AE06|nr:heparan-alpha-glucosaminide N-acetyltransferase domain-containing protein [Jonesia quinghaiensis]